jgi:MFS family permease
MRPWALAAPILVLIVSLPLLRPLRHPDANNVSDEEAARLATIAAVVEHHSLSLEGLNLGPGVPLPDTGLVRWNDRVFSRQPPTMAVLLAGPYWVLTRFHLTLRNSPVLAAYLLTLIGVTIPVAAAAGLIYKMSRVFELRRPLRCAMAIVVVFGSGLISYAVALNPHAPAAALILGSVAGLLFVANSRKPRRNIWWLIASGGCASLAMALDPPAAIFPPALLLVIFTMRWPIVRRSAGAALFLLGVIPPLYLHLALNYRITGDWKPAMLHPELTLARTGTGADLADWGSVGAALAPATRVPPDEEEDLPPMSGWARLERPTERLISCLIGPHGVLTHFPVVIVGVLGMFAVMHRHWPGSVKSLAVVTAAGAIAILIAYSFTFADPRGAMFANRWFVVFLPLTLFWSGAWARSRHSVAVWTAAGIVLFFSVAVSLVGATDPLPRQGYNRYTAAAAAQRLFGSDNSSVAAPLAETDQN